MPAPNDPVRLAQRWTAMWNGEVPARAVVHPDCAVYFGRRPMIARATTAHGPAELQSVVDAIRSHMVGVRYGFASAPACAPEGGPGEGVISLLWHVSALGLPRRSGIDLIRHAGGRIHQVWSISGDLELPPLRLAPLEARAAA
jgi:hypothetical protein